ncbi:hypothetical protein Taro_017834 [Colocasia esculenta]|uniref:Transposase n=1 Tax=Colocasia esculenta TaxID=4460 RepID=A0A843USB9_COLES|nr:hypothetical protein [Colocasia esculenta]
MYAQTLIYYPHPPPPPHFRAPPPSPFRLAYWRRCLPPSSLLETPEFQCTVPADMSSRSGSRVRRLRTVDDVPTHSPEDSVAGHPSQAVVPITQGTSSAASASSSVAETPSWGRGSGRRGPSRGATERRLEPGHKWNVRVIGGYGVGEQGTNFISHMGIVIRLHCKIWQKIFSKLPEETKNGIFRDLEMWYCWDRTPQTDKEMLQHMTAMHKGWRRMLKSKHYKGKTFEDPVASVPLGVDPSDWRTMYQKWNSREEQDIAERNKQNRTHQNMTYRRGRTSIYQLKDDFTHQREPDRMEVFKMGRCKDLPDGTQRWVMTKAGIVLMTQMTTPSLQSDDAAPVSAEDAFVAVMGRDRPGRVRCAGKAETLRTWYGRGESSSGGYHTQVQQLQDQNKKMEELCAKRSRDRQELEELCAERSKDRQELENVRSQMSEMRAFMQQFSRRPSHMSRPGSELECEGSDESPDNYDDDD